MFGTMLTAHKDLNDEGWIPDSAGVIMWPMMEVLGHSHSSVINPIPRNDIR